ncbi:Cytochrome b5 reductase 4 [Manis javanica]|nr:Cytochrome b5 reductase 4 [Manis javanica]
MNAFLMWDLLLAGPGKELLDGMTAGFVPCVFFPDGSHRNMSIGKGLFFSLPLTGYEIIIPATSIVGSTILDWPYVM